MPIPGSAVLVDLGGTYRVAGILGSDARGGERIESMVVNEAMMQQLKTLLTKFPDRKRR